MPEKFERPPVREVPLLVRLRLMFGGFNNQFGWTFFGFGMIFVWVFTIGMLVPGFLPLGNATATVTEIEPMREGPEAADGDTYHLTVNRRGQQYTATTQSAVGLYCKGQELHANFDPRHPDQIEILDNPTSDMGPVRWIGLMPMIFPTVGICFIVAGVRKGLQGMRLLAVGRQTIGELIAVEPTNVRVNDMPVYKYTFEYVADGRLFTVSAKTHVWKNFAGEDVDPVEVKPLKEARAKAAESGRPRNRPRSGIGPSFDPETYEPLVYDPGDPARAVMLDELPGGPRLASRGEVAGGNPLLALGCLIIPGVSVVGHGYVLLRLLSVV